MKKLLIRTYIIISMRRIETIGLEAGQAKNLKLSSVIENLEIYQRLNALESKISPIHLSLFEIQRTETVHETV